MKYDKQNFIHGQVLHESHLNHIEDGIKQVEDSIVALENTIELRAPIFNTEQSGDVVSILSDAPNTVKGLATAFECVQEGTGTPSSDNVRPIHGWDTVKLWHTATYDENASPKFSIDLPETVYQGTLDWLTGVLTVTHICITVTGAGVTQYGKASTGIPYVRYTLPQNRMTGDPKLGYSSHYSVVGAVPSSTAMRVYQTNTLFIYDTRFTDRATAETLLNEEKPQLMYPVATQYTYQLSPTTLTLLVGNNSLWSNTGDTYVVYESGTKFYLDNTNAALKTTNERVDNLSEELKSTKQTNNDTFANAIRGHATGKSVTLTDVSPIEHRPVIYVHGKNLWNMSAIKNTDQLTLNEDGTVTVAGGQYYCPTTKRLSEICPALHVGCRIAFSINSTGANFIYLTEAKQMVANNYILTITEDMLNSVVALYGGISDSEDFDAEHVINSIQIEYGDVVSEYVPYANPAGITVTVNESEAFVTDSDGSISITTSTSPKMSFATDNDAYFVSVNYNRDSTAVITDLLNRISALENA